MIQSNATSLSFKHTENSNRTESPLFKVLIYIFFAILPFIILGCLFLLSGGPGSYHPSNADELTYWRELYNEYADNQTVTGYNGYAGYETKLGNFSYHGITPTLLWYLPGLVFGWHMWSIPVFNSMIVSLCFICFLFLAKPKAKDVLVLSFIYGLLNTTWFYGLSSMMEIPGYGIIMLWVGVLIFRYKNSTPLADIFLFIIYVISGLYRINFFVFFFPIVITIILRYKNKLSKVFLISLYVIASLIIYRITDLTWVPYIYGFRFKLGNVSGIGNKIIMLLQHGITNITLWFDPSQEAWVLVFSRYAYTLLFGFLVFIVLRRLKKKEKLTESFYLEITAIIILGIAWALQVVFYDIFDWRDFRVLYQIAWFAIVVIFLNRQQYLNKTYFAHLIYSIIQITTLLLAINNNSFIVPINEDGSFNPIQDIKYNPNASSRWENTIFFDRAITPFPAFYLLPEQGIGLSWGIINGNESYISTIEPGYIVAENEISIPGYEFKETVNDLFLYVKCK